MKTQRITLEQMLLARERRAAIQNKMLGNPYGNCLVCLTMNIAGDIKRTPMTRMLFDIGMEEFCSLGLDVLDSSILDEATGSEAFWLLADDAAHVKMLLEEVEESFHAARLFDFDVLVRGEQTSEIVKLSRDIGRSCLICGRPAAECSRSRRHGLDAVKSATDALLEDFCAGTLAAYAYDALLGELYTTPKPGLVDLAGCGAHRDMDVPLFEQSAASLRPYFYDAVRLGMSGCTMKELRERGLRAEKEMFEATGGVNTHKGIVYSMGLLLAGAGKVLADIGSDDPEDTFAGTSIRYASSLASEDAEAALAESAADPSTNGGRVYKKYGAKGAVWEAATGFPDAVFCAERLVYYTGKKCDEPGALALCDTMAQMEDTNLLHRGGPEGLSYVRRSAAAIAGLAPEERVSELFRLDDEMTRRHLSPGGSADMLALAFFINKLRDHPF